VDYRRFLDKTEETIAPVVNGQLWLSDRRLRLSGDDGWFRVKVSGRKAERIRAANDDEIKTALNKLPSVRGPMIAAGLVHDLSCYAVEFSTEEPPLFAPLKARRIGDLWLWDELEFESEVEEIVRRQLEEGGNLSQVKGVSSALRAAFAFALGQKRSRELQIPALPAELRGSVRQIADEGFPAADEALRRLARERAVFAAQAARIVTTGRPARRVTDDLESRVEESLRGSGARLFGVRRLAEGQVEVRWQIQGTRIISIVEEDSLQVVNSGVCLAGADQMVTLDSLPGVIREAIEDDVLVITRHEDV
jgi:hypothetical protein